MRLKWDNVGKGLQAWGDAYTERRKRDELEQLGPEAQATEGQVLSIGGDKGLVAGQGVDANGNAISADQAYREAYARAGLQAPEIKIEGTGFAARAGSFDRGVYDKAEDASRASDQYNYGLMRKQADVYRRYGEDDMARQLSRDARMGEREDARFGMEQGRFKIEQGREERQSKLDNLRIKEAEYGQTQREAGINLSVVLAEAKQNGAALDVNTIWKIGSQYGADAKTITGALASYYDLDARTFENDNLQRVKIASGIKNTTDIKEIFNNHPLFANGQTVDFVPGKKGGVVSVVTSKDGKRFQYPEASEDQLVAYWKTRATDPVAAVKFGLDVEKHQSEMAKNAAMTDNYRAAADENRSKASYYRNGGSGSGAVPGYTGLSSTEVNWADQGAILFGRSFEGRGGRDRLVRNEDGEITAGPDLIVEAQKAAEGLKRLGVQPTPANIAKALADKEHRNNPAYRDKPTPGGPKKEEPQRPRFNTTEWQLVEQPWTQSWRPGKWVWKNLVTGEYMSEDDYKKATK